MHRYAVLTLLLALGCSNGVEPIDQADDVPLHPEPATAAPSTAGASVTETPPASSEPDPAGSKRFEATVSVSKEKADEKRRMVFQGVTLERPGEPMVVASYVSSKVWDALDGKRVRVLANPYVPQGRAIGGEHMKMLELAVVDPKPGDPYLGFGRPKELEGKFTSATSFVSGDDTYDVVDAPAHVSKEPGTVKVTAHLVHVPKSAGTKKPQLWITGKASTEQDEEH